MFSNRKKQLLFILLFTCSLIGIFLPWFISAPGVTDYYIGVDGIKYIIIQIVVIYFLSYVNNHLGKFKILVEVLLISVPLFYIFQLLDWYYKNMAHTIELFYIKNSVLTNYWIALLMTIVPVIAFPILTKKK